MNENMNTINWNEIKFMRLRVHNLRTDEEATIIVTAPSLPAEFSIEGSYMPETALNDMPSLKNGLFIDEGNGGAFITYDEVIVVRLDEHGKEVDRSFGDWLEEVDYKIDYLKAEDLTADEKKTATKFVW